MKALKHKFLFGLILVFLPLWSFGGWSIVADVTLKPTNPSPYNFQINSVIDLMDDRFDIGATPMIPACLDYVNKQTKIVLAVDKNFTLSHYTNPYTANVEVLIEKWDHLNVYSQEFKTLTVTYDPARNQLETFQSIYTLEGYHRVKVTVNAVSGSGFSGSYPINISLRALMQMERYFDLSTASLLTHTTGTQTDPAQLPISWDPPVITDCGSVEPEFYELEWTFVESYTDNAGDKDYAFNFRNNSSRIQLRDNSYNLPYTYPKGVLVWRVRPVGFDPILGKYIPGEWNFPESGTVTWDEVTLEMPGYTSPQSLYYCEGFAADMNWQYSVSFIEDGKYAQSIGYYDGLLYNRESISRPADGEATVSKTIYDFHRRPAMQVMPVPIESTLEYISDLAQHTGTGDSEYTWENFDYDAQDNCVNSETHSMSSASGSGFYYSNQNNFAQTNNELVPDAQGYPFVQTEFMPDNTGRVRRQSGVGPVHRLTGLDENGNPHSGKETRYYYDRPLQSQIDRLFGNAVGYAAHYQRNVVIDPNGQISVSYLDPFGRVIATALAGESGNTPMLAGLNSTVEEIIPFETFEALENTTIDYSNFSLISKLDHTVTTAGVYSINYEVNLPQYSPGCLDLCADCVYDLEISLVDECGVEYIFPGNIFLLQGESAVEGNVVPSDMECGLEQYRILLRPTEEQESGQSSPDHLEVYLGVGKYTLQKKLTVNQAALESYVEQYEVVAKEACIPPLQEYLTEEKAKLDYSRCNMTCEECETLVDEREKEICLKQCNTGSFCDLMRNQILADLSPGGQYFDNQSAFDATGVNPAYDPSIQDVWLSSLRLSGQTNEDDNSNTIPDVLEDFNGDHSTDYGSWDDLRLNWQREYADYFIDFHPEKCYLEKCDEVEASYQFDMKMQQVSDGKVANDLGYFNAVANISVNAWNDEGLIDPAFQTGGFLVSYLTDFRDNVLPTFWMAIKNMRDQGAHTGLNGSGDPITNPNGCKSDFEWAYFRALYLGWKQEKLKALYTSACTGVTIPSGKTKRFHFDVEDLLTENGIDPGNQGEQEGLMEDFLETSCTSSVSMWLEQLKGCGFSPAHLDLLEIEFLHICEHSSAQFGQPFGSTSCLEPSPNNNYSYTQALDWLITTFNYSYSSVCNDLLLEFSLDGKAGLHPGQARLDDCACDKIDNINTLYGLGNLPDGVCSKEELFEYTYEVGIPDFEMLDCICKRRADSTYNSAVCSKYFGNMETYGTEIMYGDSGVNYEYFAFKNQRRCIQVGNNFIDPKAMEMVEFLRQLAGNGHIFSLSPVYLNTQYAEWVGPGKLFDVSCSAYYSVSTDTFPTYGTIASPCSNSCTFAISFLEHLTATAEYTKITMESYLSGDSRFLMQIAGDIKRYRVVFDCIDFACSDPYAFDLPEPMLPVSLTCDKCMECDELQTYYEEYTSGYPYMLDPSAGVDNVEYFRKYLRSRHGLDYQLNDLDAYLLSCLNAISPTCSTTQAASDFFDLVNDMVNNRDFGSPMLFFNTKYSNTFTNKASLYPNGSGCNPYIRTEGTLYYNPGGVDLPPVTVSTFSSSELEIRLTAPSEVAINQEFAVDVRVVALAPITAGTQIKIVETEGTVTAGQDLKSLYTLPALSAGDTFYYGTSLNGMESLTTSGQIDFSISAYDGGTALLVSPFNGTIGASIPLKDAFTWSESKVKEFVIKDNCGLSCNIKFIMPEASMRLENITSVVPGSIQPDDGFITGNSFRMKVNYPGYPLPIEIIVYSSCHTFFSCANFINIIPDLCPQQINLAVTDPCTKELDQIALSNAWIRYDQDVEEALTAFRNGYLAHCMGALETYTLAFTEYEHHHTLYYYDRAGNLLKTVPPQEVTSTANPYLDATDLVQVSDYRKGSNPTPLYPAYSFLTEYRYNSMNQLIWQETPDAGVSQFWYDNLGRIVLSQNAKQITTSLYSYTQFDDLGRIIEVGEITLNPPDITPSDVADPVTLASLLSAAAGMRTQITKTYYDAPLNGFSLAGFTQKNLQFRIAAVAIYPTAGSSYTSAIHYTYDALGNVDEIINDIPSLESLGSRYKKVGYSYDLASGNVNYLNYQPGEIDRFNHHFQYDERNRLQEVFTSDVADASLLNTSYYIDLANTPEWSSDARYFYYLHGPLARKETGRFKIQGEDYAYTLHGWIKGVNSELTKPVNDPGQDGYYLLGNPPSNYPNKLVAQDAFSYTLGYYTGDYTAIGAAVDPPHANLTGSGYLAAMSGKDLYNGNIRNMTTTIPDVTALETNGTITAEPRGAVYSYDKLNRIIASVNYLNADWNQFTWNVGGSTGPYNTEYSYDARGNILTLQRSGYQASGTPDMDNLAYNYSTTGTNQLEWVDDGCSAGTFTEDIDDQAMGNYTYDAIGNLISDNAEDITAIDWNVYGKISKVTFGPTKNDLEFGYNPMGQRIWKKELFKDGSGSITTYYSLDAAGKMLAAYAVEETHDLGNNTTTKKLFLIEFEIYGSARLGMLKTKRKISEFTKVYEGPDPGNPDYSPAPNYLDMSFVLGNKRYEFSNHLGNVLAVLTDRPIPVKETTNNSVNHFKADISNLYDYYPFGMLIADRTYSTESCSTVTTTTNGVTHTNLHMSGTGWTGVNGGFFLSGKVYNAGSPGQGAEHTFQVLHNGEEVQITLGVINLTSLSPGNSLTVRLVDSAGTQLASYSSVPGTMFYLLPTITFDAINYSRYKLQFVINNSDAGKWAGLSGFEISQDQISQMQVCGEVDYRFGFNGMEKDNEVKGLGNSLDFGARIYDSRLGRWLSLDPLSSQFPSMSPYNFCNNNPIIFVDPDGKAPYPRHIMRAIEMASELHMGSVFLHPDGRVVVLYQTTDRQVGDLCGEITVHAHRIEIKRNWKDKIADRFSNLDDWTAGWIDFIKGDGHEVQFGIIITSADQNGQGKNFGEEITLAPGAAYLEVPIEAIQALGALKGDKQSSAWKQSKQNVQTKLNDQLRSKRVLDGKREGLGELKKMKIDPLSTPSDPNENNTEYRNVTYVNKNQNGEERVTVMQRTPPGSNGQDSTVENSGQ